MSSSFRIDADVREALKVLGGCKDRSKRWLLSRYNLSAAEAIAHKASPVKASVSGWLLETVALLFLLALPWSLRPFSGAAGAASGGAWVVWGVYGVCAVFMVPLLRELVSEKRKAEIQVYLPRLGAGTLVGFLVLLNDDMWGSIFNGNSLLFVGNAELDPRLALGRIILPLVLVFIYLLIEMNNVDGIRYPIWPRACRLWLKGFAYALLTGIVVSDLFGNFFLGKIYDGKSQPASVAVPGVFGNIYPEVIVYLSPLAFFIGVFVQLLWEDKALTERI